MADVVAIVLQLQQLRQFVSGTDKASRAIGGVGTSAEKSGKRAQAGWKGVAKWAGGATALYGAQRFIRGAVSATEDLGKATLALERTTGMDVETSSAWASMAKARGLSTKQLQVGFVKLSKEVEKSRLGTAKETAGLADLAEQAKLVSEAGGKKAPTALATLGKAMERTHLTGEKARATLDGLGVSGEAIRRGDTEAVLNSVADGLARMTNPMRRAAVAQQLFGRGGQALLPVLMKGRKGIADQLAVVRKYGATLGVKTVGQLKEMMASQRELRIANEGMKVQLGTALLPVVMQVEEAIVKLARALTPLTQNGLAFKAVLGVLIVLFLAYKIAVIANTLATIGWNASLLITLGVIGAVILILAALAIGFYLLYKRVGWFRAAVDAAWKAVKTAAPAILGAFQSIFAWVKRNWPLLAAILVGPIGLAVYGILRYWDKIVGGAKKAAGAIASAFSSVKEAVRGAINWLIRGWNAIQFRFPGVKTPGPIPDVPGFTIAVPRVPELALGGTIVAPGLAVVGERGAELLSLPTAARVTPLPSEGALASAGGLGGPLEVVVPVYLDSREIARAVGQVAADQIARR